MSIRHWTTQNLEQVVADGHFRGKNGADYWDLREEIQDELYKRQTKQAEAQVKMLEDQMAEYESYLEEVA